MNTRDYMIVADELKQFVRGDISLLDKDREKAARDTSLFYVKPELVIFPKDKEDIISIVQYVAKKKKEGEDLSLTMRAAGTCMTGGPLSKSIVLDTTRYMHHMLELTDTYAVAEPGMYYRDFEKQTLKHGWIMPSYPASRELAAIGGIVSNNSGGEKTLTYGKTERYVAGLSVVYANGEEDVLLPLTKKELDKKMLEQGESGRIHKALYEMIIRKYEMIKQAKPTVSKNSSGYYLWNVYDKETEIFDLTKLIVGSQGTLASVTSATITGVRPKNHSRMIVMFVPSTIHLGEIITELLKHKPETIESYDDTVFKIAIKFFKDIAVRMGGSMFTLGFQFLPEFWMALTGGVPKIILMAEFAGDSEDIVDMQARKAYEDMKSFALPTKYIASAKSAKKYWTFRRESFALLRSHMQGMRTVPTIDDIIVHPLDLPEFLPRLDAVFKKDIYKDLVYTVQGHMGDANFHIIPLADIHKEGIVQTLHQLMDEVYALVFEYKGSMSAEHNDGLLRTAYLPRMFSPEMIKLFEETKTIFDPQNILNPGKKVFGDKEYAWSHIDTAAPEKQ